MHLTVLFFASLKDEMADRCEIIDTSDRIRIRNLWEEYQQSFVSRPSLVFCAVNKEYTDMDRLLEDGDELAFFPPVTGG